MGGFRADGSSFFTSDFELRIKRQREKREREEKRKKELFLKNKNIILDNKNNIIKNLENKSFKVFFNEKIPYFLILSSEGFFINIFNYFIKDSGELITNNIRINLKDSFIIQDNKIVFTKNDKVFYFYLEENFNLLNEINKIIKNNSFRF
tara:strand:- start:6464 stop:6913 length:450 start_codon:yes stop_codon:yes gene_type:complete